MWWLKPVKVVPRHPTTVTPIEDWQNWKKIINFVDNTAKFEKKMFQKQIFMYHYAYTCLFYDGASVKAEKKYLNFFSPPFFQKTAEKKYLNLFSPTFFPKQQKK